MTGLVRGVALASVGLVRHVRARPRRAGTSTIESGGNLETQRREIHVQPGAGTQEHDGHLHAGERRRADQGRPRTRGRAPNSTGT